LYLRLIDSCITQLKAQGPSRTRNESKEEEEDTRSKALAMASEAAKFSRVVSCHTTERDLSTTYWSESALSS